jgi:hypothetical protein
MNDRVNANSYSFQNCKSILWVLANPDFRQRFYWETAETEENEDIAHDAWQV